MRQVIVDASGKNARIVILHDRMENARETAGSCIELDTKRLARESTRSLPARWRAAPLWITVAFLATTWASETLAFSEAGRAPVDPLVNTQPVIAATDVELVRTAGDRDFETVQASQLGRKSVQVAQATVGETEELQKALEQEHRRAELFERLMTLSKAPAESARLNQALESEYAELRKSLRQVRERLKQTPERSAAELCKSLPRDGANDSLEQDLAAARRDIEAQKALAARSNDDATQAKQAAESEAAELKKSLQQERERAERLTQDLAASRDVKMQIALVAKANDDATQSKQAAEAEVAELKKALQQERQRAERLAEDLTTAQRDVKTQTALAAKANDDATRSKQAAESEAAELKKALQQERQRTERLGQDLVAARRDIETQTALAAKASEEANQLKKTVANGAMELRKSLQQEQDKAKALAQDLAEARAKMYAYEAQAGVASDEAAKLKQVAEGESAGLRKSLRQNQERVAQLEQDLAAARRDVGIQTALARQAGNEASQQKQVAENGYAELKRSLQKEHDRAEALAHDLSLAYTAIFAWEAQTRNPAAQPAGFQQPEGDAEGLRKSLVQESEQAARLRHALAAAQRDVEIQTALTAKVNAEAMRLKQAGRYAELLKSLQQERDRAARLERELASERDKKDAPAVAAAGQITRDKRLAAEATRSVPAGQAAVTKVGGKLQLTPQDVAEATRLVTRASVLLAHGDIGSARIVLERAAETGSAQASFALAETYDPLILPKWGTYGTLGDTTKARDLYAKAQAGGIKEATERLNALRH
jgi:hypothetical protein